MNTTQTTSTYSDGSPRRTYPDGRPVTIGPLLVRFRCRHCNGEAILDAWLGIPRHKHVHSVNGKQTVVLHEMDPIYLVREEPPEVVKSR